MTEDIPSICHWAPSSGAAASLTKGVPQLARESVGAHVCTTAGDARAATKKGQNPRVESGPTICPGGGHRYSATQQKIRAARCSGRVHRAARAATTAHAEADAASCGRHAADRALTPSAHSWLFVGARRRLRAVRDDDSAQASTVCAVVRLICVAGVEPAHRRSGPPPRGAVP